MFWDKKEEKSSLPDLPQTKIPYIKRENLEKNTSLSLPEFPDLPKKEEKPQIIKKEEQNELEEPETANAPENPKTFKTIEMEEWTPQIPKKSMETQRLEKEYKKPVSLMPATPPQAQDIFVKIEKFRNVRRTLNETKDKLEEIDSLLHKIRETKMREEQELAAWEREIATAKTRIQEVTSSIFEKVE